MPPCCLRVTRIPDFVQGIVIGLVNKIYLRQHSVQGSSVNATNIGLVLLEEDA